MSAVERRTQFVKEYARRSKLNDEWALLGFIQIGQHYRIAMPCDCNDKLCKGWQMVEPDAVSDIALSLTTKSAGRIAEMEAALQRTEASRDAAMQEAQEEYDRSQKLKAENAQLRQALTPSGDTKADYIGEIIDPNTRKAVSWSAIKMVMAMISARAELDKGKG